MKTRPLVPPPIDRWVDWKDFQRAHTGIFPTPQSFEWFMRANGAHLRKRRLLTKIGNKRRVDGPGMAEFIEQVAQANMAEASEAAS